jgi:beta-N-acetylhexosaminidase
MNEQQARHALGQVFALRFPRSCDTLDLERYPVANYIIFKDALGPTLEASRERISQARNLLASRGIQALFMMDEEGGRVTQIAEFFPSPPSQGAVARALSPNQATDLYAQFGAFLAHMGIDIDLAPCLDVNTEALNPIIGTRSFGADAKQVTTYGRMAIRGLRRSLACAAKHFPGHGMTRLDSHLALPIVEESLQTIQSIHMAPFQDAVEWHVDGIMVGHCLYRALASDGLPASLSGQVVNDHLRINLGYQGLVLTDSLDMQAVVRDFSPSEVAIRALAASCDILLYTEMSERFEAAFAALLEMLLTGKLDRDQLAGSARRRAGLLQHLRLTAEFKPLFDLSEYTPLADAARAAAVRIQDRRGTLPLVEPVVAMVSTSAQAAAKLRDLAGKVEEIGDADDHAVAAGKDLILWLVEPLTLRKSLEGLRRMLKAARRSVLVTTYDALAEALGEATATIVTSDMSPKTEDDIIALVCRRPSL